MDSNPRCREGFQGRNSARVWRAIWSDKMHPCSERVFVRLGFGSASALSGSLRSPRLNADHGELLMLGNEVADQPSAGIWSGAADHRPGLEDFPGQSRGRAMQRAAP